MDTQLRLASSAIALAAMVLIWNEAPIAASPSDREYAPRVAYSDHGKESHGAAAEDSGAAADRRERVVRGGRTGAGPAAVPAKPGREHGAPDDGDRTGTGPKAEPAVPAGPAPNVAR